MPESKGIPCRSDCVYYSAYTKTCDFNLLMFERRGCTVENCTRYKYNGGKRRTWGRLNSAMINGGYMSASIQAGIMSDCPEPPIDPPEERYVYAECGHEVYDGEIMYESDEWGTLCAECVSDRFDELSVSEKAELIGLGCIPVCFRV